MLISEIYESCQGEGLLTGRESVFVRTSGCNLRCTFCDTPFASWTPEGDTMTPDEMLTAVDRFESRHIVLTGGEPMIQQDVAELCQKLKTETAKRHITIETAGTVFVELQCDLMSISPKLGNSTPDAALAGSWLQRHEATRERIQVIDQLINRYDYQLKYVVGCEADLDEITAHLDQLKMFSADRVLLMPEGIEQAVLEQRATWLEPLCKQLGFVFCPRRHIEWYGNKRGT